MTRKKWSWRNKEEACRLLKPFQVTISLSVRCKDKKRLMGPAESPPNLRFCLHSKSFFFPDRNHAIIMPVMIFSVAAEQSCYHYKTQWFFRSAHKWFSSVSQEQNGHWQRTGDDSKTFEVQIKSESIKFVVNPHRIDCWHKLLIR